MQDTYKLPKESWRGGDRSREHAFHLMFLAWMHWAEPEHLTGLSEDDEADQLWLEIYDHFGGEAASDPEFLFVASIMASIFPWVLGDDAEWEARSERMAAQSLKLKPEGFPTRSFTGRGHYGDYFVIHATPNVT